LYGKLSNDRITRWRLLLEEYGPKYVQIAGKNNIVADALSRLEKYEDAKLSEIEEGLILSHAYLIELFFLSIPLSERFAGLGGFLVALATQYIIRWFELCVFCFLPIFCCLGMST
jgi:hypothetical protein